MEYTSKGAQLLKSVIDRQIANGAETVTEQPANVWERDGATEINSGEISGMEARDQDDEIVGDSYTSYYKRANERACFTYYVEQTKTRNQPDADETAWVVEYAFHFWKVDEDGENTCDYDEQYDYDSASPLFYYSQESADRIARNCADRDESFCLG